MTFLAIDVGTSFIKAAVLDLDTLRVTHVQRLPPPESIAGLPPLFVEIDAEAVAGVVRDLIERLVPLAPDCRGIVMCGQMGGVVLTDEHGIALSNYISWRDQRTLQPHPNGGGSYFDVVRQRLGPTIMRQLGHEVRPGLALALLFWLAKQRLLPRGPAIPTLLPDFVLAKLCHTAPRTEATQATGTINLETGDWHREAIAALGLDGLRWPKLIDYREPVGEFRIAGRSLLCYPVVGDHQCSLAGALLGDDELSLNISTGSQVSRLADRWQPGDFQTRPYFDGRFLNTITNLPGGRALDALVRLLTEIADAQRIDLPDPWSYVSSQAATVIDTDLDMTTTFFAGALGDHGSITNIREDNLTVGHLFRAAFRNMADNYLACALRMSPDRTWSRLAFSGGLVNKLDPLRAEIVNRFACPHRVCPSAEDGLQGLLVLALTISGRTPSVAAAIELVRQSP
jgi:sugar (pentulose or hexulose) kinase